MSCFFVIVSISVLLKFKTGKSVKVKKLQTASVDDILGFGVSVGPTRPIRDAKKVPKEWAVYYDDLMNF